MFNPKQYAIIRSYVTLCREDVLDTIEKLLQNLKLLNPVCLYIDFGYVARFSNGKGILFPAIGNNEQVHTIGKIVLDKIVETRKKPEPPIALMHPGDSTCTNEIFERIMKCLFPSKIRFNKTGLIEQDKSMKWNIIEEFELSN